MAGEAEPQQNNLDTSMMRLIKRKVKAFNPSRKAEILEDKINIAYLCGRQNVGKLHDAIVPLPENHKYYTLVQANKILPAVINDIAVSTKAAPTFDVVPAGTDEDDKATAKAGEKILPYLQRINDPHFHRKGVVLWYDIAGSGWRKVYWNPYFKVIGKNPLPDDEGHDPNTEVGGPIFQGEVVIEFVPNNELIYDRRVKDIRKLKWIIHNKSIAISEARERFGNDIIAKIPAGARREKKAGAEDYEIEIDDIFDRLGGAIASIPNAPDESELVEDDKHIDYYEFWHVMNKSMPQGAYAVGLGDLENLVSAVNEPYPEEVYKHKELPIIGASPLALSGISINSPPRISQARPLQREYNDIRSKIADHIDAMGSGVIMAPTNANLDFKKIDNLSGCYIEYDGPFKPSREAGVPLVNGIFAHLQTVLTDLDEIFAFHEPSKGKMPEGGPRSAIGLQVLQEADNTQLSPMIIGLDEADARVAYQALSLALANYGDRLIQIVGDDNRWALEQVSAKELNGKINVLVRTGSSLPLNKTIEMEKTVFAWQSGLLGNPQDPSVRAKVLKAMDLGTFDQVLQDSAKHSNFAKREFVSAEQLAKQMPYVDENDIGQLEEMLAQYVFVPPVNSFDDHFVHQQEHSNYILSNHWKFKASNVPQLMLLADVMVAHNNMHGQAIYEQQMQQLQMTMLEKGVTLEQKGQTIEQIKAKKPSNTSNKK